MKSLNSVGDARRTLLVAGMGMFIAFLFLAPLAVFAAGSVTITTDKSFYAGTQTIKVSGTVTPTPATAGTSVAISITGPTGSTVDANQFVVSTTNGTYSGTFVTGGPGYATNGTYTIKAIYGNTTGSAIFQYGNASSTTTGSGGATTTTVVIMSTIVQQTTVTQAGVGTTTTVVQNNGGGATTVTQMTTIATTVVSNVTTNSGDSTALAIGAVGLIVGIIAAIIAVLAMRKK
jgi:hypothetical protein